MLQSVRTEDGSSGLNRRLRRGFMLRGQKAVEFPALHPWESQMCLKGPKTSISWSPQAHEKSSSPAVEVAFSPIFSPQGYFLPL